MNLCKDCKFYIKWSGNFDKSANWSDVIRKSEHLCTKTNQVNFSNITGEINYANESCFCDNQRDENPSTLYPRCGYDGKWFEKM